MKKYIIKVISVKVQNTEEETLNRVFDVIQDIETQLTEQLIEEAGDVGYEYEYSDFISKGIASSGLPVQYTVIFKAVKTNED